MNLINVGPGEALAVVSTIDPQTVANSAVNGDAVDMSKYHRVAFFFALGDMASEVIDCLVQEDSASAFNVNATTYKAATQLAASASANDNRQVVIEVEAARLADGNRYVRPRMVTGGATGGMASCIGLAVVSREQPASAGDLASVAEIARK
jgi:hypothetical protein